MPLVSGWGYMLYRLSRGEREAGAAPAAARPAARIQSEYKVVARSSLALTMGRLDAGYTFMGAAGVRRKHLHAPCFCLLLATAAFAASPSLPAWAKEFRPGAVLQTAVDEAIASGKQAVVELPAGDYYFGAKPFVIQGAIHLLVRGQGPPTET